MPLPAPEARQPEREDERQRLYALLEAAAQFFEELKARTAPRPPLLAEARRRSRGHRTLPARLCARFPVGAARGPGAPGLQRGGHERGRHAGRRRRHPLAYDRFRHRLMFPITDLKERVIAFGGTRTRSGRAGQVPELSRDAAVPQGPRAVQRRRRPRPCTRKTPRCRRGLHGRPRSGRPAWPRGVAPLGTALTADQVKLMWRFAPEPILCFDGDAAGRRAAFRAVETVLPHLRPGLSVAFAFLPDGLDPDDLVRQQGAAALEAALARARPLADVLWEREWASGDWTTPERRARLELQIRQLLARIDDGRCAPITSAPCASAWPRRGGPPRRRLPAATAARLGRSRTDPVAARVVPAALPRGATAVPTLTIPARPASAPASAPAASSPWPYPRARPCCCARCSTTLARRGPRRGDRRPPPHLARAGALRDAILSLQALDYSLDRQRCAPN